MSSIATADRCYISPANTNIIIAWRFIVKYIKHASLALILGFIGASSSASAQTNYHYNSCVKSKWAGYVWHTCNLPKVGNGGSGAYNWVIPQVRHNGTQAHHTAGCMLTLNNGAQQVQIQESSNRYWGWYLFTPGYQNNKIVPYSAPIFYTWPRDQYYGWQPRFECYEQGNGNPAQSWFTVTSIITTRS